MIKTNLQFSFAVIQHLDFRLQLPYLQISDLKMLKTQKQSHTFGIKGIITLIIGN